MESLSYCKSCRCYRSRQFNIMMKQAEAQADERQMAQEGGLMETEDTCWLNKNQ